MPNMPGTSGRWRRWPVEQPKGWNMNDTFEKKVRAASVAGWWVVLIAIGFLTLLWLIYLAVMSTHPAWLLTMWGPGIDWPFVQNVWFWVMAVCKFCVWLMILGRVPTLLHLRISLGFSQGPSSKLPGIIAL